ncbi:hypothetical protein [Parafrankia sp. EUN1f]|uniref:hypothetical protein n=1 Tax=Parafrankia sp. EUN1f TaxID=102897 RepID=UPI0001C463D6|nr:hypothetical protein [Parafrankia sp. EUN1f]EFC81165.1 hypothetical protein FrEUN1fDRAFT_5694 [Parafrankia sp. EUN1f]
MAAAYYPRVASTLQLATLPDDLLASPDDQSSPLFLDYVGQTDMAPFRVPMPIDWNYEEDVGTVV